MLNPNFITENVFVFEGKMERLTFFWVTTHALTSYLIGSPAYCLMSNDGTNIQWVEWSTSDNLSSWSNKKHFIMKGMSKLHVQQQHLCGSIPDSQQQTAESVSEWTQMKSAQAADGRELGNVSKWTQHALSRLSRPAGSDDVSLLGMLSRCNLCPLIAINCGLNATACLSIVDHVDPLIAAIHGRLQDHSIMIMKHVTKQSQIKSLS